MREKALALYAYIIRSPLITIVPYTPSLREQGLELYAKRSDKSYSITDCISMVIMKQLDIQNILTHDKHFTQEGFTIIFTTMY
jgi:predicted nucleic acid-binding protein